MLRRLLVPVALVGLTSASLAACGSDGGERLTQAEFVKQVNGLCKQFDDAGKVLDKENFFDLEVGAKVWAGLRKPVKSFVDGIDAVNPPEASEDAYDDYVDSVHEAQDRVDDAVSAAKDGEEKDYSTAVGRLITSVDTAESTLDRKTGTKCFDAEESLPQSQAPAKGATVVDVTAKEYAFEIPEVKAGKVAIKLHNEGDELHIFGFGRLKAGHTFEELKAKITQGNEDPGLLEDEGITGLAVPDDSSSTNADLKPGTYVAYCFIPAPDGTPHLAKGMLVQFDVS